MPPLPAREPGPARRSAARFKRALTRLARQIHVDVGGDVADTVLLAGGGRGGTTWVAEILNHANDYRFIFEPFYAERVPLCRSFRNRQYIREDDAASPLRDAAARVLSGRFRSGWADFYNRKLVAHKRLIKEIRANLFLKWIRQQFPAVRIVLLLRHPCAVAASRMFYGWGHQLEEFLDQPQLMTDFLEPFRALLTNERDEFARHVVRWCVETFVPLRQFAGADVHVALYEDFQVTPHDEVSRLFAYLGKPMTESVMERLGTPSRTAWEQLATPKTSHEPPNGWKRHVSPERERRALEILQLFGLDAIYSGDPMPNSAAARAMTGVHGPEASSKSRSVPELGRKA